MYFFRMNGTFLNAVCNSGFVFIKKRYTRCWSEAPPFLPGSTIAGLYNMAGNSKQLLSVKLTFVLNSSIPHAIRMWGLWNVCIAGLSELIIQRCQTSIAEPVLSWHLLTTSGLLVQTKQQSRHWKEVLNYGITMKGWAQGKREHVSQPLPSLTVLSPDSLPWSESVLAHPPSLASEISRNIVHILSSTSSHSYEKPFF